MVDLAKIRKKAKKKEGSAGVPPAGPEASSPPEVPTSPPVPPSPPAPGGGDAAGPAGGTPALQSDGASLPGDKLARFKEQAGQRRETRVEQVVEAAQQLELLTFLIAGEQYAIEIEKIVEIVTPRPVTRIPNADPSVVGIISLRGTIVTLVDVRRKLRHPASAAEESSRIVVIDLRTETIGFVVDRVLRVVKIAPSEVEPHPVVHMTELEEAIRGVFRTAGALTILLDLDKLLGHSQWT